MAIIGENISIHSFGEYLWSNGDGWGSGYGYGTENGNGHGSGGSYGYSYGDGDGYGYGYGYGYQGMETAVVPGMKTWTEMRWRFR